MGACHGRLLHAKMLEMLEGTSYGSTAEPQRAAAGRDAIARWGLMYFEACCELTWDPVAIRFQMNVSDCGCGTSIDLADSEPPSGVWKLYAAVTKKLERAVLVTEGRHMFQSTRNDVTCHNAAVWLVERALIKRDVHVLARFPKCLIRHMRRKMVGAARKRLRDTTLSAVREMKGDSTQLDHALRIVERLDPRAFVPRTLEVWKLAGEIANGQHYDEVARRVPKCRKKGA